MRNRARVAIALAALLMIAAPATLAVESSYHETASEFQNASQSTNLNVEGSGDDAKLVYTPPDLQESTTAEFRNGTLTNVSVSDTGDGAVAYDGLQVASQYTDYGTGTEPSPKEQTNLKVQGSGNSARLVLEAGNTIDSFEDGDLSEWTNTGGASIVTSPTYKGEYAMRDDSGDSSNDPYRDITPYTYDSIGIWMNVSSFASDTPHPIFKQGTTNGPRLRVDGNGEVDFYDGSAWTGTGITITTTDWYQISIDNVDYANNQYDIVVTYANGSTKGSYADAAMQSGISEIDRITLRDFNSNVYHVDQIHNGTQATSATYRSANHSVSNATEAAVNISELQNAEATITVTGVDGSDTTLNQTTVSSAGNTTLTWSTYSGDIEVNVSVDATGSSPSVSIADDSILSLREGKYQSQDHRAPEATGAYTDLTLPGSTNATVIVEGYDGSSWSILANTKYTSSGNKSVAIGSGYETYRTTVRFSRSDSGPVAELEDLGYDATKAGEYVGTNHSISNATDLFLAANISDANVTATVEAYNTSTESWDTTGSITATQPIFDDRNLSQTTADTYRVRLSVEPNGSSPVTRVSAEGLIAGGGTTVVEEVSETTADTTPFLLALSDSANTTAQVTISDVPVGAFPDYVQATVTRQIRELLGFEEATSAPSEARKTQQFYNENSDSFTTYINSRIEGDEVNLTAYDTIAITWKLQNETMTKYWLGLRDGDAFAATTIENSTTREIDKTLVLSGYAAVRSEEELRAAHRSFVQPGTAPSSGYGAVLRAQYGPDISGTLVNGTAT